MMQQQMNTMNPQWNQNQREMGGRVYNNFDQNMPKQHPNMVNMNMQNQPQMRQQNVYNDFSNNNNMGMMNQNFNMNANLNSNQTHQVYL